MDIKGLIKSVARSPLFGNEKYGNNFDDSVKCAETSFPFPVAIAVRQGAIIDNLGFEYDNFSLTHGGKGGTPKKNTLNAGEHIIKVEGNCETFKEVLVIKSLSFTTDSGRTIKFGTVTSGKGHFEYEASPGYAVCALHGQEGTYLGAVGFCTKKIEILK